MPAEPTMEKLLIRFARSLSFWAKVTTFSMLPDRNGMSLSPRLPTSDCTFAPSFCKRAIRSAGSSLLKLSRS